MSVYTKNSKIKKETIFKLNSSDALSYHKKYQIKISNKPLNGLYRSSNMLDIQDRLKKYGRHKKLLIPHPSTYRKDSFRSTLSQRTSERIFSTKKLTLQKISNIFHYSCGININTAKRYYPSAGAKYPLEVYFISTNTELPSGIYHYSPEKNQFEQIAQKVINPTEYIVQNITAIAGLIVVTAVFGRTFLKYGERAYRYILLECGHMGQNFCLNAVTEGAAICPIGAAFEEKLENLLKIDGVSESIISVFGIGERVKHGETVSKFHQAIQLYREKNYSKSLQELIKHIHVNRKKNNIALHLVKHNIVDKYLNDYPKGKDKNHAVIRNEWQLRRDLLILKRKNDLGGITALERLILVTKKIKLPLLIIDADLNSKGIFEAIIHELNAWNLSKCNDPKKSLECMIGDWRRFLPQDQSLSRLDNSILSIK